jgi:hypothetical protein
MVHFTNEAVHMYEYYDPAVRNVNRCILRCLSLSLTFSVIYGQLNLFFLKYATACRQYITLCVKHIFLQCQLRNDGVLRCLFNY